jgi:hypothetical protein
MAAANASITKANPAAGRTATRNSTFHARIAARLVRHTAVLPNRSRSVGLPNIASPSRSRKSFNTMRAMNRT